VLNFRVMVCFAFSILTLEFVFLKIDLIVNYKFQDLLIKSLKRFAKILKARVSFLSMTFL
jgi:hypothetical protein